MTGDILRSIHWLLAMKSSTNTPAHNSEMLRAQMTQELPVAAATDAINVAITVTIPALPNSISISTTRRRTG